MNDKLTIQELAAYLPWEVECSANAYHLGLKEPLKKELDAYMLLNMLSDDTQFKLNLLPLSSLTKEIEHKGERFVPIDYFLGEDGDLILNAVQINDMSYLPYNIIQKLLSWNFDLFGLLDRGLAVDKTTIL